MILLTANTYIISNIRPALIAFVSAGLVLRMYYNLIKLQESEDISTSKIIGVVKKYVGLIIIINILSSIISTISSYFK